MTQQVIIDDEVLFVAIYDLYRVKQGMPSAELVIWHKQIDAAALSPSPTATQFGHYSFNSSMSAASHEPNTFGFPPSPTSPTSPSQPRGCAPPPSMFPAVIDPWATSLLPLF